MKNFLQFENRKREYKSRSCVLAVEVAMKKVKDRRTKGRKLKHHLKKYYDEVDGAYYTENDDDDYAEDAILKKMTMKLKKLNHKKY